MPRKEAPSGNVIAPLGASFQKWTRLPHDYEDIYQQALKDMQAPDFRATWNLTTTWGTKSMDAKSLLRRGLT